MTLKIKLFCVLFLIGTNALPQGVQNDLDRYFLALSQNQEFNGNILFAENGKIIYQKSFGYSDFQNRIENTDLTRINLASVSKTFTAIAVLQLKEKGKLNLDDTFAKYFTTFPYPEITIKQLLSHTSGLPDNEVLLDSSIAKNPGKLFTNADIIPALIRYKKSRELRFKPGEKWGYSNVGYSLLALLIEKVSHRSFDDYMKRKIFVPAGMTHSYVQTSPSQKADKNRCINYMYSNHYEMRLQQMDSLPDWRKFTYNLAGLTGSTNVISTINDLWHYDKALLAGRILKPALLQEAFTPVKLNNGEDNKAVKGSYGLGWFVEIDSSGEKMVSHSGAAPGVTTFIFRNLGSMRTLIILQNIQNPTFDISCVVHIMNGNPIIHKKSVAFAYAKDIYNDGPEYALARLHERQSDTIQYILTERDMARVGLEFSRNKHYQHYSLEAYRLTTEVFPNSWKACNDYADILLKNNQKEDAIKMYQKSIELNPKNLNGKIILDQILK